MTQSLIDAAKLRRTYYVLGRNSPVADSEIIDLVQQAVLHIPSAFNTQSTRVVVALHGDHEKVWDVVFDAFKGLVAAGTVTQELFDKQTKPKLDKFKANKLQRKEKHTNNQALLREIAGALPAIHLIHPRPVLADRHLHVADPKVLPSQIQTLLGDLHRRSDRCSHLGEESIP